jgi:hypothetical protein
MLSPQARRCNNWHPAKTTPLANHDYRRHLAVNPSLTIPRRLRYRKDFGSRVVARLMAWRPRRGINERSSFNAFFNLGDF